MFCNIENYIILNQLDLNTEIMYNCNLTSGFDFRENIRFKNVINLPRIFLLYKDVRTQVLIFQDQIDHS